ncbi:GntR family transcriptional regulator [Companilactobacillus keshanensis]|uniref:GntR family transcriptional regulator n=1 Tax=Companilactobacillus keshanensis TaxID=2486003 RepID=A0ABW4BS39_9LACO|nr:GntR family transcriptional regulator [Companilactobacillus keshanensis]
MQKKEAPNNIQAYETLRDQILNGKIPANTKLTETMLADKLNISRTPIREAIIRLEEEGLVKNKYVYIPSETDIRHIFQVRSILEGFAAKYSADFISTESLNKLKEYIKTARNGDDNDKLKANYLFHQTIVEETHNPEIVKIINKMQSIIYLMRKTVTLQHRPHLIDEHEEICQEIENGNGEKAEKLVQDHLAKDLEFSINRLGITN